MFCWNILAWKCKNQGGWVGSFFIKGHQNYVGAKFKKNLRNYVFKKRIAQKSVGDSVRPKIDLDWPWYNCTTREMLMCDWGWYIAQ